MRPDEDDEDIRLTRLLGAVRAEADPSLWTRVRARAETRPAVTGLLAWAMRPAALASSVVLLLAAAGLALTLSSGGPVAGEDEYATLDDELVAERAAEVATPPATTPAPAGVAGDSGTRL